MNNQFKKLANKPAWASSTPSSNRHEISAASPAITRTEGFSQSYSLPRGHQVEYQTMNQLLRELSSAGKEAVNGVPYWDQQVPYKTGSTTFYNGAFYIAIADGVNRPPAAEPTYWERVNEYIGLPAPVRDVEFDVSDPTNIKVKWAQGKDNGSLVSYSYSWRFASGSGNANASTDYSNISIATSAYNIPDGDVLIISIFPHNSNGSTPVNLVREYRSPKIVFSAPAGGRDLPLAAARGNSRALLSWNAPTDTGGRPITGYTIQWRKDGGSYGNTNQSKVGVQTSYSVIGLINDQKYYFRVRAINVHGEGEWSNEATATPIATPTDAAFPTLRFGDGDIKRRKSRLTATTDIVPAATSPTYSIQSIEWNYRKTGDKGWRILTTGRGGEFYVNGLGPGQWNIRYRLKTSVGYTPWSPIGQGTIGNSAPVPPKVWCRYLRNNKAGSALLRHQVISLVTVENDGGSPVYEVQLRGEQKPVGASYHFDGRYTAPIRISHRIEANTHKTNLELRRLYNNEDPRLWSSWGAYADGNSQFTIFGRARNEHGWSDWAEGNTIIQA